MSITSEIERIKNAKTALKSSIENKGVSVGNGLINTYASKVDEIEGSDSHNAFEVSSIEEMNNLTNVKDGDFCTIYGETLVGITEATSSNVEKLTIYNEFSLNEKLTGLKTLDLLATGAGDRFVCGIYPVGMTVQYNIGEGQRQLEYTSEDGINFSTTGFSGTLELSFSNPISSSSCDAIFSQVVKIPKLSFGGVYQASVVDDNVTWNQIITGGNHNAYKVATIQERNALIDVKDGDVCVVQESSITPVTEEVATTGFDSVLISDTIVLDTPITDYYSCSLADDNYTAELCVEVESTLARINYSNMLGRIYYNWMYSSQDGITYTLNEGSEPVGNYDFGTTIHWQNSGDSWNNAFGYFLQIGSISFSGIYQASVENNLVSWGYLSTGLTAEPQNVYEKTFMGSNGVETGTLTTNISTINDINNKIFAEIFSAYKSLSLVPTTKQALQTLTSNCYLLPFDVDGTPLVDTSSITDFSNTFVNYKGETLPCIDTSNGTVFTSMFISLRNLKEVPDLDTSKGTMFDTMFSTTGLIKAPNLDLSHATNLCDMFYQCANLVDVPVYNLSSITTIDFNGTWPGFIEMFWFCKNLTNTSLDNLLQSLITAINVPSQYKKFFYAFGKGTAAWLTTAYPASRIQALPHYQDFINAGWTIGY